MGLIAIGDVSFQMVNNSCKKRNTVFPCLTMKLHFAKFSVSKVGTMLGVYI